MPHLKALIPLGLRFTSTFTGDKAETGRTTARPDFREMISLARRPNKPFEQILVWKYSRFARNREDSILYKAMLKKTGVQVVSINEPFDDTPTGRLLEAIYPFPPASGRAGLTICPECHILPKRC